MHQITCLLLLLTTGICLGRFRDSYDNKNLIIREEPVDEGEIVECPVCDEAEHWLPNNEECQIVKGNKTYKKCRFGTYFNEVCGNRLDCYRGPGEQCTEKMEVDMYGKKCAPTYYCNKSLGICTGHGFSIDTNLQYRLDRFPYTWRPSEIKRQIDYSIRK